MTDYRNRLINAFTAHCDAGAQRFIAQVRAEHLRGDARITHMATNFFQENPDLLPADFGYLLAVGEVAELERDAAAGYDALLAGI